MRHRFVFSGTVKDGYIMFEGTTLRYYYAPGELYGFKDDWYPAAWELSEIKP